MEKHPKLISRWPSEKPARLSLAQQKMWRDARERPESTCYNEPITIYRKGPLEISVLERTFMELMQRHESWRTSFEEIDGEPAQVINAPPGSVELPLSDVSHLPEAMRETEALALAARHAETPFDLDHGPLFRARVVKLGEDDYRIFITVHHLIIDGITVFDILFTELTAIYNAIEAGRTPTLPKLQAQYADFACWQAEEFTDDVISQEAQYWRRHLSGAEPARLPTEFPRNPTQPVRGSIVSFILRGRLSEDLRLFSQQRGVTPFLTLLTAFAILLHRYTGEPDLLLGTITPGGRKRPEFQRLMGLFQNRVPLRIDLTGDPVLVDLLVRTRNLASEALCHDDVPFEIIADRLQAPLRDGGHSFYSVLLSLVPQVPNVGPGWGLTTMDFDPGGARLDLNIEFDNRPEGISGSVQFNRDLFTKDLIHRMIADFQATLDGFIAFPDQRLSDIAPLEFIRPHAMNFQEQI
ncbi:MAG: amino acid adenylation enzyme/thioester reductase family protein [Candidatus Angelobacter sp.]|nr:amino acid adenylation enzyme/thioester reductase family protein [Candidatus Angelobacter sp.]